MITVLLADDQVIVRDCLRYLLENAGDIEVAAVASNGLEAVNQAGMHCPDVAVIDISMPAMDGIQATRQIRVCCPEAHILVISMHLTPEYIERSLEARARGYVLKDMASDDLVAAVRSVYRGDRYFSTQVAEVTRHFL
jgi:DNA-binding NarL/FixJ family response regulator